jgi:hypothetical protein
MAKDRILNVRIDAQTEERLEATVRLLAERGPEPTASQVVRHAIDQLYARLRDESDDAERSGSRDEERRAR